MATITVQGYVQEREGKRVRVSESYSRKNEQGDYETTGYADYTVWLRDEDAMPQIGKGVVILVHGKLVVQEREVQADDGSTRKFKNLNINAYDVGVVRDTRNTQAQPMQQAYSAPMQSQPMQQTQWAQPMQQAMFQDEAPF